MIDLGIRSIDDRGDGIVGVALRCGCNVTQHREPDGRQMQALFILPGCPRWHSFDLRRQFNRAQLRA